jgi:hypothetical protein
MRHSRRSAWGIGPVALEHTPCSAYWTDSESLRPVTGNRLSCGPDPAALLCLSRSILIAQHDEREAGKRRYASTDSMLELAIMNNPTDTLDEG